MTVGKISRILKPGVPRSVHLFFAPFLWFVIGCMLMTRGILWMQEKNFSWLLTLAFILGTLKSFLILDKVARKSVDRLTHLKDGTCLGAIYSWKSWLLVAMMMTTGVFIRRFGHPGQWVGMLYCAVGWALCFSSRLGWSQWYALRNIHEK